MKLSRLYPAPLLRYFEAQRFSRADLLFRVILGMICLQIAGLMMVSELFVASPVPPWASWSAAIVITLMISALLVNARMLISKDAASAKLIAEYIKDGLLFVDGRKIAFANPLARKLVGNARIQSELSDDIASLLDQAQKSLVPIHYEAQIDGRDQHFLVSSLQLPDLPKGSLERQVYVFQDVTFLRENEEAKVNFIGALSHEIKTPITSLAMALAMIDRTGFDQELVRIANADVGRLRILLDDLLNVSRLKIVRNPHALHKQDTNLSALIHQTVKASGTLAAQNGVQLINRIQTRGHVMADIDPTKISWVLSTLITDAIRQTPAGETVTVQLDADGTLATLTVQYRRRLDAVGPVGHAIVRDIIESHAGRFVSLHRPEQESAFKFSLHAYFNGVKTTKGMEKKHEANLTG